MLQYNQRKSLLIDLLMTTRVTDRGNQNIFPYTQHENAIANKH